MLPTIEEIETAERKRAIEMPMSQMAIDELRVLVLNGETVHVRRLALTWFENAAYLEGYGDASVASDKLLKQALQS